MVIIFGFLVKKSTLEKYIKTLKIDRQSNRIDSFLIIDIIVDTQKHIICG